MKVFQTIKHTVKPPNKAENLVMLSGLAALLAVGGWQHIAGFITTLWQSSNSVKAIIAGVLMYVSFVLLRAVMGAFKWLGRFFQRAYIRLTYVLFLIKKLMVIGSFIAVFYWANQSGFLTVVKSRAVDIYENYLLYKEIYFDSRTGTQPEPKPYQEPSKPVQVDTYTGIDYKDAYEGTRQVSIEQKQVIEDLKRQVDDVKKIQAEYLKLKAEQRRVDSLVKMRMEGNTPIEYLNEPQLKWTELK